MWHKALLCGLILCFGATGGRSGPIDDIQARHELVVGAKADYPPYGFKDGNGEVIGVEPELAADLAKRLHVPVRIVPVLSSNRLEMLLTGKVDLIIATMSITDERRKIVGIIDPPYYASGAGILYRRDTRIEEVADLSGKTVCTVDGNIFLLELRSHYPAIKTPVFKDLPSAETALFSGRCDGLFFDDTALFYKKSSQPERFKDFDFQQLIEIDPLLWGVAVKSGEEKTVWGKFVSETIVDWHKSGFLLDVEKKWLGSNTVLLKSLKDKWTQAARVGQ